MDACATANATGGSSAALSAEASEHAFWHSGLNAAAVPSGSGTVTEGAGGCLRTTDEKRRLWQNDRWCGGVRAWSQRAVKRTAETGEHEGMPIGSGEGGGVGAVSQPSHVLSTVAYQILLANKKNKLCIIERENIPIAAVRLLSLNIPAAWF